MKAHAQENGGAPPHVAVCDDPKIRELINDCLGQNEERVSAVADGRSMSEVLEREAVDLIVLGLRLPTES